MNRFFGCSAALLCAWATTAQSATDTTAALTARLADDVWIVQWGDQQVCSYAFGTNLIKPYVRELCPLGGPNLLRDSPSDHRHHHALMYGIRANGVNFWEETGNYGVEASIGSPEQGIRTNRNGTARAVFRQRLNWKPAQAGSTPILVEQRSISVTVDPEEGEVALIWRSEFEPADGVSSVQLEGANYHGLGVRFLQDLDPLATHCVGGERLNLENNRQDVRAANWAAVSFQRPNQSALIALAGSPSNRGAPSHFFSMLTPFAYLSATQNLDQSPLQYSAGDQWTVSHLVLVYPEAKSSTFLDQRVSRWSERESRRSSGRY